MNFPLFLIPILAGLMAQGLKPLLNRHLYATMQADGRRVPRYGGMPSAHSAFVFSLATLVGVVDGIYSTTFVIAVAAVILILDDALRLRIFLAGYGQVLDRLVRRLPAPEQQGYPYVETRLGHRPLEVTMGGLLGIVLSLTVLWLTAAW